jgi:Glu-tRNA(Gln) amidotransferase subunit E-like FAD-binding protein
MVVFVAQMEVSNFERQTSVVLMKLDNIDSLLASDVHERYREMCYQGSEHGCLIFSDKEPRLTNDRKMDTTSTTIC